MKKPLTLGVDLGGSKINVGLVDATGHILSAHKSMFDASKTPDEIITDVHDAAEKCLIEAGEEAEALGIGVAAQVDKKGVARYSQNLGWHNVPLKDMLKKEFRMPVGVTNDVNAATLGEWRFGSGKNVDDLAVLFVGTGVGGGVITGGKLLAGCTNSAGELGHITIVYKGRKCHCPNKGCLEAYVGGWAIAERAQNAIKASPNDGQFMVSLAGNIKKVSAATVSQAYREGDLMAKKLVEETGQYLAAGVVSIVNCFNPCLVVLGGGVVEGIPELLEMVKTVVKSNALEAAVEGLNIVKAALGNNAGVIGAASLAQDLLE